MAGTHRPINPDLVRIALDNQHLEPTFVQELLQWRPTVTTSYSEKMAYDDATPLLPFNCPQFPPCNIRVLCQDPLDAAIDLQQADPKMAANPQPDPINLRGRVVVLSCASVIPAGGGWRAGVYGQEESICYRSTLPLSLHDNFYPLEPKHAIFTPSVLVYRHSMAKNHAVIPTVERPLFSVISISAQVNPPTTDIVAIDNPANTLWRGFDKLSQRNIAKANMRLFLRLAGKFRLTRLVLGPLGCGPPRNPRRDVACCWFEVLRETEFSGGWWEDVVFAIEHDKQSRQPNDGSTYEVFLTQLEGLELGSWPIAWGGGAGGEPLSLEE